MESYYLKGQSMCIILKVIMSYIMNFNSPLAVCIGICMFAFEYRKK